MSGILRPSCDRVNNFAGAQLSSNFRLLGLEAATSMAWAWGRFGHLINVCRFFQVIGIFLILFMIQVGIYSFHEFSEAGVLPNSEVLHAATEKFSPEGVYGQWFSLVMVAVCAAWLLGAWLIDRINGDRGSPMNVSLMQPTK